MMERVPQPVREMLALLRESGHTPYLVGGCVRDLLRGAEPDDYDMTSDARPEEVMTLFGADAHPTGLMHGTVTLVRGGFAVEHTTERCDGAYRDSRHPESVRFTSSIEEDLARRDFTVNAIALSADGRLVDPFGGREDLRSGVLRCVGDPAQRFGEDALRILRLLRFASVFGFLVEENTARAARERRDGLRAIAHERVYAELNKLLCGEHAAAVLLEYPDILGVVLPEILPCVGFDQRIRTIATMCGSTRRARSARRRRRGCCAGRCSCTILASQNALHRMQTASDTFTVTPPLPRKWRRRSWRGCASSTRSRRACGRSWPASTRCFRPSARRCTA